MKDHTVRLDNMRIASPCPVGWDQMTGDDRVRRCDLCELHVYDIARMTRREAESLIANTEGRICARIFRRADGTVITRDCPVGLRAVKRRVAKTAAAVFAATMSLCVSVAGQKPSKADSSSCLPQVKITRKLSDSQSQAGAVVLRTIDVNGAVVAGAEVTIMETADKDRSKMSWARQQTSDAEGHARFPGLAKGTYDLKIDQPGFMTFTLTKVEVGATELVNLEITLTVSEPAGTIGIVMIEPLIEPVSIDSPLGTTIITRKMIESLPHEE